MAFKDALFQLGMDLTRSSTAQKEDIGDTTRTSRAVVATPENTLPRHISPKQGAEVGRFQDRVGSGIAGSHLIVDLFGARRLDDADLIEKTLRRCAELAGASVHHVHLNAGTPEGVSGFAAISGGHISIHTHPQTGCAALDIFVRGEIQSVTTVKVLEKAFSAARVVVRQHSRGDEQQVLAQASAAMRATPRSRARVRKAA